VAQGHDQVAEARAVAVRVYVFGSPRIEYRGAPVALPFERRSQLVVLLALKRAWVTRADLAAMFWPDMQNRLAYANLRKILFRLQALPWAGQLEAHAGAVRFEAQTDAFDFETALREQRFADALALRTGELLAGFDDGQNEAWTGWLNFERDRLRVAWRGAALSRLADDLDPAAGIELSAQLLDADPLDEAALRAHIQWLARAGQAGRARQAYRDFVARLDADLGLAPGPELKALHDGLARTGTITPAPPPVEPVPDDGFVGRTTELRRLAELLAQDDCRLVCVVGPGGAGKTRLARRALAQLAPGYADGGAFVPLEDVVAAGEVGARLARELDIGLSGSADALDQVIGFLRERQMLLVLDNFEQLAGDAAFLQRLLQACPRLRCIVTSRVRLALAMEWLLPLEGLPCPGIEDQDRLEAFDAVQLFVRAARRVEPALVPAVEAASIVEICRQVDGLPLALQLAAAWTRVLSCDAIAAELRQGTELLRAVDATHPARHASFEVVFDHSWRMLTAIERDVLARLAVFRGGFAVEAARAVAVASLPVLGALADKSLLRKDGARLFLHPLVHQLAAVRLGSGAARAATEAAHAQYFHRLMTQLQRPVEHGDRDALERIDTEFDNCRAAWRWAIEHGATDALLQSAPTLLQFCDHRGRFEEGLALLSGALEAQAASGERRLQAFLRAAVAHLTYRLDRYNEAETYAAGALAAARGAHDPALQSLCLKVLGSCCLRLGRHDDARRHFKQALQRARAHGDPRSAAAMLDNLALVEKTLGRYADALQLSIESLVQHRQLGDAGGEALCLNNLGALHLDMGDFESAAAHLREGLALCDRHGIVNTRGLILANLTELALKTHDAAAAEAYGRRTLDAALAGGNRNLEAWLRLQFAQLALRRGDPVGARAELEGALAIALAIGRPSLQLAGVCAFAQLLSAQGEAEGAWRLLTFAAGHPQIGALERDAIRRQLAEWPSAAPAAAGLRLELAELVHRILVESDVAQAPLIASLRAAP
jgi:predicted ATPase/Tfp pilus assembly protein PilF